MRKRSLTILTAVSALATVGGWAWWQQHEEQLAADMARYEAVRNQRDYRSERTGCALRFPSGSAGRVDAYADSLRVLGYQPELADSSDDSEGEQWAEFYDTGSADAAAELVAGFEADLNHVLIRQRLWQIYFDGQYLDAVNQLESARHVLARGHQDSWRFHIGWIATPYPPAGVLPPVADALTLPERMLDQMRAAETPPWQWRGLNEPGMQAEREAFADSERHALNWLKPDSDEYRDTRARHTRRHHHFYLVEAARDLGSGKVLILRRFGQVYGPGSVTRAAQLIAGMVDSVQCGVEREP